MVRVLFVCLGNICRSPMAEAVFKQLVEKDGLGDRVEVDSAGTGDWHIGHPPHEGTRKLLDEKKISYQGMKARQVVKEDLSNYDYIIAMDSENLGNLRKMAGYDKTGYVGRLLDFVPASKINDVPDPYFTGNFDEVYQLVTEGCENLLEKIKEENF
ncbi:protein-tyrosine phosphatase [Bacillus tianshenii]|uniref:protein-tyrosine-phosphatase n=2 Tax=Sutcliffiella tianshenii TaxID=1463404 RepID=A0ABS2NZN4_9BACI|nr:low molecular weight protein-tyrosine-phosphatase [Bacillus tianshenii]MBM7619828.1 protein-tyrosine phosphatase [Bacillus tianshenii]